jgi:5-carboxymethyl-2-hydroxymuconic-semialdehyde dehydrogenase
MPIGGLRTRAERRDIYAVADGDPENAFVAVLVRLGQGRDAETRRRVAEALMTVLEQETAEAFNTRGLGLTVEVQEIDGTASLRPTTSRAIRKGDGGVNQIANPKLASNLSDARRYLDRYTSATLPHLIGGERVLSASGDTFEAIDPSSNERLCTVAAAGPGEIDRAARAAASAFKPWRDISGAKRRKILHAVADAIEARADEIALIESTDTGQPIRYMSKAALRGAENFRFYADRAPEAQNGLSLPDQDHINYTFRQPIGPVGVITPWNTPFMLSTWKIAPALAAGCTVVHKPAEWSPLSAMILTEIMDEVIRANGLPPASVNLVQGLGETGRKGADRASRRSRRSPSSARPPPGRTSWRKGAPTLKRVHFELGGKNPVIVFEDADLDRALDAVLFMIYSLNGERCTSSSRALVQRSVYEEFSAKVAERVKRIRIGHPLDPDTELGPLIHPRHADKVLSYPSLARRRGLASPAAACAQWRASATTSSRRCISTRPRLCALPRKRSSGPCSR